MVKIRLKRMGSKFRANYKIVVADARAPRDGRFIEALGNYDPATKKMTLNEEATQKWINEGAQITETVYNLFRKHKLNEKFAKKIVSTEPKKETKETEPKKETKTSKPTTKKTTTKTTAKKTAKTK